MRNPRLVLAAVSVTVLAGALAGPSLAAPSAAPAHTTTDGCLASVPETAGGAPVQICYSIHKPASASTRKRVPMVLHSHGWAGSRSKSADSFASWLDQGFGVLTIDQRGFGESGGKAHIEDPDFEGQDIMRIVDVVAGLPWVAQERKGDPVLGAIGGSYGGGYQLVGAFTELMTKGKTRFDALAPEITWWSLSESLAPNAVPKTTWSSALYAAGMASDAHTTPVHEGLAYAVATGQWPDGTVPGFDLEGFLENNGPAWHVAQGRKLDIPVLFRQGITDSLFPLDQGLKIFDQALTKRARAKSIFTGYNGGHVLPATFPLGLATGADTCSAKLGSKSFTELSQRFMRTHLLGLAAGLKGAGQYHLTTADGAGCLTVDSVKADAPYPIGVVASTAAAGAPVSVKVADGPITIAGTPTVQALVTSAGVDNRVFTALSIGTSAADAKTVQGVVQPQRELLPTQGAQRTWTLPSVSVSVPAGQSLFLTLSPVSEMFAAHGSRTPGAFLLQDAVVTLPLVERVR
ncbi:MAG TPA: alpha/beta fold hydrolase [Mycobacteriales bacterium]|nr:alpha/beta fold hydrolase [Mycobacteriales bacterium]